MGGKFAAEQFCITARHEYPHLASQETVDEEMPTVYILNLVKEEVWDVGAVKLIYAGKNRIQIICFHPEKPVIVEVDVTVTDAVFQQDFVADG